MDNSTLKWLWRVPGCRKGYIAALTILQVILGGTGVWYALLLRNIVDNAVAHDGEAFRHFISMMILLIIMQLFLSALIRWLNELARSTLENIFKQRLTENILRKDYSSVSATHTAEWLNRLTNDTVVVAYGYVEILPGLAGMVVRLLSALVMLIVLDSHFAMVLLPGGLLLVVLTHAFRRVLKRLHKQVQESDGRLRVFLQERIGNLMVIKAFSAENQTEHETALRLEAHKASRMRKNRFSNFCNLGFSAAMHGMYLFGVVYCAWGILTDTVTYGTLTAVMQLIGQIQAPFANISGYLPRWYAMAASAERLMEVETYADDIDGTAWSLQEVSRLYREAFCALGFRDVSFTYPGDDMPRGLNHLTLEIHKGEIVAFTGHSGCGKSTVLKLLLTLYAPESGEQYIRCSDGTEYPLTARHRKLFAYVPQGNALMNGTIREVVSFADLKGSGDEERLLRALETACADGFVNELEKGLSTELGERGAGLSEGQIQRLAIARAVFSSAPVLLLDEATSALDEETEKRLLRNLKGLGDKTVIIVTHRPQVLSICDRILEFSESGVIQS